jgi:hypothetical protein
MATREIEIGESAEQWIHHADDSIIACRATGHGWPKIKPGKASRYIKVTPDHDGCYQLVQICRDCGMQRMMTTLPGGEINFPAKYSYIQPDGYKSPKGSHVIPRDCLAEAWRRTLEVDTYKMRTS